MRRAVVSVERITGWAGGGATLALVLVSVRGVNGRRQRRASQWGVLWGGENRDPVA